MLLVQNMSIFYLLSVQTRLEIVLVNDFVEKKETFLSINKKRTFQIPKNRIFPKGLTPAYKQKMQISSLFRFDPKKTRNNA